jgi:TPR repeat protein/tRNA A-37 threonylcarbamoyl transferase component Bud32
MPDVTRIGRYEVRAKLGSGAFGTVYRAYDPQLQREIALKVLRPEALASPRAVERFRREARAAARMLHPNIVLLHDAGEADGSFYIASTFIKGRPLSALIPSSGMEGQRAAELALQLAEALAYAHEQGVIHRDVKPDNALVDESGRLLLADFGLAGGLQDEGTRLTGDGAILGTPAYMSPEQADGRTDQVGPLSDLYGAGVVLYAMLTGHAPFAGPLTVVLFNVLRTEPPRPSALRPNVDPELEAICLKAMAKKPKDRYPSAEDLAAALRGWLTATVVSEPAPAVPARRARLAPQPTREEPRPSPAQRAEAPRRSAVRIDRTERTADSGKARRKPKEGGGTKTGLIVGGIVVGVLLLAGVGFGIARLLRKPPVAEAEEPPGPKQGPQARADATLLADFRAVKEAVRLGKGAEDAVRARAPERFAAWREAAEKGVPEGQYFLGRCYHDGVSVEKSPQQALAWFRKAADQGLGVAMTNVGFYHQNGRGVPVDLVKAVEWYRRSAEQGEGQGQINLAICYENGHGVGVDLVSAAEWYRKAAEQGYVWAQNSLGLCYQHGKGLAADPVKAVEWFRKSAEQGHASAQYELGWCYQHGKGVGAAPELAFQWYRKAAFQGHPEAENNLGYCYQVGIGVGVDAGSAFEWYRRAAEQGLGTGQSNLGWCYQYGKGVAADPGKAVEWYRKAANQGNANGQYGLGACYEKGIGVVADPVKAAECYRKAAAQGHEGARKALAALRP